MPRPVNRIHSTHLYVTFADDFLSATVRNEEDEARINGELFRLGKLPPLSGLKLNGTSLSGKALTEARVQRLVALPANFFPPPERDGRISE